MFLEAIVGTTASNQLKMLTIGRPKPEEVIAYNNANKTVGFYLYSICATNAIC